MRNHVFENIDTLIGLPSNLFFSTGIPVCILVLKKCKKEDDVLFINASDEENFEKGKRQNYLREQDIQKIVDTYQERPDEIERYARRVSLKEIEKNDFNLNIFRYVSTAKPELIIDLKEVNVKIENVDKHIKTSKEEHNSYLKELGLGTI